MLPPSLLSMTSAVSGPSNAFGGARVRARSADFNSEAIAQTCVSGTQNTTLAAVESVSSVSRTNSNAIEIVVDKKGEATLSQLSSSVRRIEAPLTCPPPSDHVAHMRSPLKKLKASSSSKRSRSMSPFRTTSLFSTPLTLMRSSSAIELTCITPPVPPDRGDGASCCTTTNSNTHIDSPPLSSSSSLSSNTSPPRRVTCKRSYLPLKKEEEESSSDSVNNSSPQHASLSQDDQAPMEPSPDAGAIFYSDTECSSHFFMFDCASLWCPPDMLRCDAFRMCFTSCGALLMRFSLMRFSCGALLDVFRCGDAHFSIFSL